MIGRFGTRLSTATMYGVTGLLHVAGWGMLLSQVRHYPAILSLGILAYGFGLRHAFDADHISAIDNVTRKILQSGKRAVSVGFFFSLGHSTVVLVAAVLLGAVAHAIASGLLQSGGEVRIIGGIIGTLVSGLFLIGIGILNLSVLRDVIRALRHRRSGEELSSKVQDGVALGGLYTRLFGRLFRFMKSPRQMYPVGILFGLGFDTATEIALLTISAGVGSRGVPVSVLLALPLIFAAGMTLMDTTEGVFMAGAYSWALTDPVRKLFYNLFVTGVSVLVALLVGGIEIMQIIGRTAGLSNGVWDAVSHIRPGVVGLSIAGLFAVAWPVGALLMRFTRAGGWNGVIEERAGE